MENILPNSYKHYKYLLFFGMIYVAADLASNVVLYKTVKLGEGLFPGGVFVVPLIYCVSDIINEIYGYHCIRQIIWFGILCDIIFMLLVVGIIHLPSPASFKLQSDYDQVLGTLIRANVSSIVGIVAGRFINVYLLSKFKILLKGRYYFLRSVTSTAIGEFVVLIIVVPMLFIGVLNFSDIVRIITSEYALRIVYAIIITIPSTFVVIYLKRKTGIDVYDYTTNFNPFKISD